VGHQHYPSGPTSYNANKFQNAINHDGRINGKSATSLFAIGVVEAWDAYNQALESSPLLVKSVTAGVILGCADLAGQAFEKRQRRQQQTESADPSAVPAVQKGVDEGIEWARVARFAIFGLVLQAPWNHFYYLMLDSQIPPTEEPFSPTNTVKIVIDQFVQAPIFTVLIFVFLGLLEGKGTEAIEKQLKNDYKDTIIANCKHERAHIKNLIGISMHIPHHFLASPIFRETLASGDGSEYRLRAPNPPSTVLKCCFLLLVNIPFSCDQQN